MTDRTIFCQKLQRDALGLERPPYPGPLGERIYQSISQEVWKGWLRQQTILINENRLNMLDPKTRPFLEAEMTKFLFGEMST